MSSDQIIVVTGASGFLGSTVVRDLLEAGYTVRGTVRSISDKGKIGHLLSLQEKHGADRLTLHEADLLQEGSFTEAISGSHAVFHTASPFQLAVEDPQRDLVDPAVKGTLNVLNSCVKTGTKRVVLTSSFVAVFHSQPPTPDYVFTEDDWNLESTLANNAYFFSKRLAEETAWSFAREHGIDLTAINPSLIIGPTLSPRIDATSVKFYVDALEGKPVFSFSTNMVAVADVSLAHIRALQRPEVSIGKRFIVSSQEIYDTTALLQYLKDDPRFASYPLDPLKQSPLSTRPNWTASNARARELLGIEFRSIKETSIEAALSVIDLILSQSSSS